MASHFSQTYIRSETVSIFYLTIFAIAVLFIGNIKKTILNKTVIQYYYHYTTLHKSLEEMNRGSGDSHVISL